MGGPIRGRFNKRPNERGEILGRCGMDSKQDNAGSFQGDPLLYRDLPRIFVERENEARLGSTEV